MALLRCTSQLRLQPLQGTSPAELSPQLLRGRAPWAGHRALLAQPCSPDLPGQSRNDQDSLCVSDVLDTPSTNDIPAVQKAKTLYRSCINESKCPLRPLPPPGHLRDPENPASGSCTRVLLCASFFSFVNTEMCLFYRVQSECQQ